MAETRTYAILGSTGNCGSAILTTLLQRDERVRIRAFCRNKTKLLDQFPGLDKDGRVQILEGSIQDLTLMISCVEGCQAVFLCVSTNDNLPGCRLGQDTASAVIKALLQLKRRTQSEKLGTNKSPKLILLSSGTVDEQFSHHVPRLLLPILERSASFVYKDLVETERMLRAEEDWLTSIYMKPGALSVDEKRGYALSLHDQEGPTSYLDLAEAMIEAVDDPDGAYDCKSVSTVCTNGPASFPLGTPLCILTGLLRHYFPWLHQYLPLDTGPKWLSHNRDHGSVSAMVQSESAFSILDQSLSDMVHHFPQPELDKPVTTL
jgi:putative NADH-flavin reductase